MVPRAVVKADKISILYVILRDELEFVRSKIKEYYDKYRLEGIIIIILTPLRLQACRTFYN